MKHIYRNMFPWAMTLCLLAPGCGLETEVPDDGLEAEAEADRPPAEDEVPTEEEQRREQKRRAALVADLDPSRWEGWESDGEARFATPKLDLDEDYEARAVGIPDEEIEGAFALADGRQFRLTRRVIDVTRGESGEPSEFGDAEEERMATAQLGIDTRTLQAWSNMTKYPWRAAGTILSTQSGTAGFCSAALIGPRVAITAGHCVYNNGAWSWNTWFSPGHRGMSWGRFPNGAPRAVVGLLTNTAWTKYADADHDIGFLVLADAPNTASLGNFGFGAWDTDDLEGVGFGMLQYPAWWASCSASPLSSGQCGARQYYAGSTINNDCGLLLEHKADTNPGSSGSPVYRWLYGGGRYIVGPHAYGLSPCDSKDNKAVALTKSKFKHACNLFANFPSAYRAWSCY